jgi:hypothetical protein
MQTAHQATGTVVGEIRIRVPRDPLDERVMVVARKTDRRHVRFIGRA